MPTLAKYLVDIGVGARLRGVEAEIEGELVEDEGRPGLKVGGTNEIIRLAPLTRIIQLDFYKNRAQPCTRKEREAYRALLARWKAFDSAQAKGKPLPARIIGTVNPDLSGGRPTLEVRWFEIKRGE